MQPAGILFDFDGVVVDSLPLHLEAWQTAHQEMFGAALDDATLASLMGRSTRAIARLLTERQGAPGQAEDLAERKRDLLRQNRKPVPLIRGIRELLAELKQRRLPFGIASNAPREFIGQTLKEHGLEVDHFLGIEDYTRAKPSPEPYLKCARLVGIPITLHRETYVFEDSTHGLKAAVAAAMFPLGVTSQHDAAILVKGGARATCTDMLEVLERGWLDALPAPQ